MDFLNIRSALVHTGFIAQEVDSAAQASGFISSIVHKPTNSSDPYSVSYSEIVVPLVKAVQELSNKYDSVLTLLNPASTRLMNNNNNNNNNNEGGRVSTHEIKLKLPEEIIMSEAHPNPNDGNAEIDYYLPSSVTNAKIIFTDMLGNVIYEVSLQTGYGTISVNTEDLPNGNYTFSLFASGKVIDSKKMLRNK